MALGPLPAAPKGTLTYLDVPVKNALIPSEGPKAIPFSCDFSGAISSYGLDLTTQFTRGVISNVQTIYFDNSQNNAVVTLQFDQLGQTLRLPPRKQGYVPVLAPQNPKMVFSCTGGTGVFSGQLLNVPVDAVIFDSTRDSFVFNNAGYLLVSEPYIDALITNNAMAVRNYQHGHLDVQIPQMAGTGRYNGRIGAATTSVLITTGAPRYFIKSVDIGLTGLATLGVAGVLVVSLVDSVGGTIFSCDAYLPAAAAPANVHNTLLSLNDIIRISFDNNTNLSITLSVALTGGHVTYNITGGHTTITPN
jgi:hypothetical protein